MNIQLKSDIKLLAEKQSYYRNQRKTINIVGERETSSSDATSSHFYNRHKLRLLYAVQGLLKGKTFKEIEPKNKPWKEPLDSFYIKKKLEKLLLQYSEEQIAHNS